MIRMEVTILLLRETKSFSQTECENPVLTSYIITDVMQNLVVQAKNRPQETLISVCVTSVVIKRKNYETI